MTAEHLASGRGVKGFLMGLAIRESRRSVRVHTLLAEESECECRNPMFNVSPKAQECAKLKLQGLLGCKVTFPFRMPIT